MDSSSLSPLLHILSVCRYGAGRSQIAGAVLAEGLSAEVRVVGTEGVARPVPESVRLVMGEVGLTPVQEGCRGMEEEDLAWADVVVCFAEEETWPEGLSDHRRLYAFSVEDGKGRSVEFQRGMRDEVIAHTRGVVEELR